jgi:signal transduction histidine kinase
MLTERLTQVVTELSALQSDAEKADRGNKAAARRVRVALQDAKKALQEVRQASFGVDSGEGVETAEV